MVAANHPAASLAGVNVLEKGGNAVDAALAAMGVMCIAEPNNTGVGGDLFAIVWQDGVVHGLDAAGPAPERAAPLVPVEDSGPRSVTVPGAVAGWSALSERFGRIELAECLADGIRLGERGLAVGHRAAEGWQRSEGLSELHATPRSGEVVCLPQIAAVLREIAVEGPDAIYTGKNARAIAASSWIDESDLISYEPHWVEPMSCEYHGTTVYELRPPTQGVVALEALMLLQAGDGGVAGQVESVRLALEDGKRHVRDGADVAWLLEPGWTARRRRDAAVPIEEPAGGTVYVCAVDEDRLAVSLIQSLYSDFGSRVMPAGTGIVLQNRGANFSISGGVEPGRRPYHTIIPGMLAQNGELIGPLGVVGGFVQAQAQVQVIAAIVDDGCNPQAALDRPRFRVEGDQVLLEEGLWGERKNLAALGVRAVLSDETRWQFGCGQAIVVNGTGLVGGSDSRGDGAALGL